MCGCRYVALRLADQSGSCYLPQLVLQLSLSTANLTTRSLLKSRLRGLYFSRLISWRWQLKHLFWQGEEGPCTYLEVFGHRYFGQLRQLGFRRRSLGLAPTPWRFVFLHNPL